MMPMTGDFLPLGVVILVAERLCVIGFSSGGGMAVWRN